MKKIFLLILGIFNFILANDLPENIKIFFPDLKLTTQTPAFLKKELSYTTNEELQNYLEELTNDSKDLTLETLGLTSSGKKIPYVILKDDRFSNEEKITIWIHAMQHGDEPSSSEAAMSIIAHISKNSEYYLKKLNVIIVPRLNMDGAEKEKRYSYNEIDMNNDHIKLILEESKALKRKINIYKPKIIIDIHSYPASLKEFKKIPKGEIIPYYDILMFSGSNRNIPENIGVMAMKFQRKAKEDISKRGITSNYFYSDIEMKNSQYILSLPTGTCGLARNAYGLQPSISLLVEARGRGIGTANYNRRVESIVETVKSILNTAIFESENIKNLKIVPHEDIVIIPREEIKTDNYKFIELSSATVKEYSVLLKFDNSRIGAFIRKRPIGYIVDKSQKELIDLLKIHGIKIEILNEDKIMEIEEFIRNSNDDNFSVNRKIKEINKGQYFISLNQDKKFLIPTILELEGIQSVLNIGILKYSKDDLKIYRVIK